MNNVIFLTLDESANVVKLGRLSLQDGKIVAEPDELPLSEVASIPVYLMGEEISPDEPEAFLRAMPLVYRGAMLMAVEENQDQDQDDDD